MGVARAPGRLPCGENGEEGFKNTGGAGTHTLQAHHMGITRVLATSKPPPCGTRHGVNGRVAKYNQ